MNCPPLPPLPPPLEVEQEVKEEDRSVQLREDRKDKNRDLVEFREEDKEDKVIKDKEDNF